MRSPLCYRYTTGPRSTSVKSISDSIIFNTFFPALSRPSTHNVVCAWPLAGLEAYCRCGLLHRRFKKSSPKSCHPELDEGWQLDEGGQPTSLRSPRPPWRPDPYVMLSPTKHGKKADAPKGCPGGAKNQPVKEAGKK